MNASVAGVAALSLTQHHGCAALDDGTARCWGRADDGQLGDGLEVHELCSGVDAVECALSPVAVEGLTGVIDIATGHAHSCAITAQARVFCWGSNEAGQLGVARAEDRRSPTEVVGL